MNVIIEQMKAEIESLTKERDEFKAAYFSAERCASDLSRGCAKLQTERDKLKAAAKLAMDVCVDISGVRMNQMEYLSVLRAIAALKAAGVE